MNASVELNLALEARIERFRSGCDKRVFDELLRLNAADLELVQRAKVEICRLSEPIEESLVPPRRSQCTRSEASHKPDRTAKTLTRKPLPSVWICFKRFVQTLPDLLILWRTPLFDPNYYRRKHPCHTGHPILDFVIAGAFEGLSKLGTL